VENGVDICPRDDNPGQEDLSEIIEGKSADGVGDACDLCPYDSSSDNRDLDGDGKGNPCDDDDDGDNYPDVGDNCPEVFSKSQLDWDEDGFGFDCDVDEQINFGAVLSNVNQRYVRLGSFRTPIPICFACTATYLPPRYTTVLQVSLPILYEARVVNSYGEVVAKGLDAGPVKTLTISPLALAITALFPGGAQGLIGGDDLPLTEFGPEAIRYYLEIEPAPGTNLELEYPLTLTIEETTLTEELFLPIVVR
jgi:hypothetical protein